MAFYLTPVSSIFQFFDDTGIVLSGGKVFTYLGGTSTPQATYTDITGNTPNANPIILNSAGRLPNVQMWQPGGVSIKIIVTDANSNQLGPVFDQLPGINDSTGSLAPLANPASGSGADLVANAMRSYDIFSSVRSSNTPALQTGQTLIIDVQGGSSVNDGIGGLFYWNAASTATDDNQNVIKLAASGTGRFIRLGYIVPNAMVSFANFTALRAVVVPIMAGGQTLIVCCQGGATVGDGLGGEFYWSASSSAADDDSTVIKPSAAGSTGRFLRLIFPPTAIPQSAITQYFAQNFSGTDGYTTFPNGLIIQWGHVSAAAAGNPVDIAVTFPIVFPTACRAVLVATERSVAANGQSAAGSNFASSLTTTGCTVTMDAGSPPGTASGRWLAIGS